MTTSQPNRETRRKTAKADRATTPAEFKKKKADDLVRLPSGNRVKMRRPGMLKFLEAGFLPDPLAEVIKKEIGQRTGKVESSDLLKTIAGGENLEMLKEMMRATDRIAAFCVTEPTVVWHEREVKLDDGSVVEGSYEDIPDDERDPEIVYTDEMELEDKMFIFQLAVGGSSDLSRFRQATGALVGDLSAS